MKTLSIITGLAVSLLALPWGCSSVDHRLGVERSPEPGPFVSAALPEAGADAEAGLIAYCPSSQCPPGFTTCPDSRFPCDTNILADSSNCGACGNVCPAQTGFEAFSCVEGKCQLECRAGTGAKDCDGLIDNGCESMRFDTLNCGACGVACAAGETCNVQDLNDLDSVGCGCPPGKLFCATSCRELHSDDAHCGACNRRCDATGGAGAPQYPNMYYGCDSSECGALKCMPLSANCDADLENGCETSVASDDNCGYCGNACGAGQRCVVDGNNQLSCACVEGLTFCQTGERLGLPTGFCADLAADFRNCGACGNGCQAPGGDWSQQPECDYGKCIVACKAGWANCNGSQFDGCEIDTKSDPTNCGGCGITCDLVLGQACVAGKCVVEPCDQIDAGEVTR